MRRENYCDKKKRSFVQKRFAADCLETSYVQVLYRKHFQIFQLRLINKMLSLCKVIFLDKTPNDVPTVIIIIRNRRYGCKNSHSLTLTGLSTFLFCVLALSRRDLAIKLTKLISSQRAKTEGRRKQQDRNRKRSNQKKKMLIKIFLSRLILPNFNANPLTMAFE